MLLSPCLSFSVVSQLGTQNYPRPCPSAQIFTKIILATHPNTCILEKRTNSTAILGIAVTKSLGGNGRGGESESLKEEDIEIGNG